MSDIMEKTKYARKVDAMGRITIPIRLREQVGIKIGEIYEYSIFEIDGSTYLCIECPEHAPEAWAGRPWANRPELGNFSI